MIELSNIRIDGELVYADVRVIDPSNDRFRIVVSGRLESIVACNYAYGQYVGHARAELIELYQMAQHGKPIPTKKTVAWY